MFAHICIIYLKRQKNAEYSVLVNYPNTFLSKICKVSLYVEEILKLPLKLIDSIYCEYFIMKFGFWKK